MSLKKSEKLRKENKFHIALEILKKIEDDYHELPSKKFNTNGQPKQTYKKNRTKFYQDKAQCYYQDLKLPTRKRFSEALEILNNIEEDDNPFETSRLKGAVYKRKYQHGKDIEDLYKAIKYYEKASENVIKDMGYGAGNTVFLYYLLLYLLSDSVNEEIKKSYLSKIFQIQQKHLGYLEQLNKKDKLGHWEYASMSSLYLSRGDFEKAKEYIGKYYNAYLKYEKKSKDDALDRELYITIKQTIELFNILPTSIDKKEKDLEDILSIFENTMQRRVKDMINSVKIGKIGLALSGGGFRASLFHIGTFMRLAELDILRNVQVISTVSGGSIIGMYYYLELKQMLENKENNTLIKDDYIDLVNRIKDNFSKAIRDNNIRMQAFIKPINKNLTEKLVELYQEKLYHPIYGENTPSEMSELKISPMIDGKNETEFIPEFNNFELEDKIPRIIVNATLLNNGHNWQFTAEGMGENPYMVDETLEKNTLYEFEYYKKIEGLTEDDYLDKNISIAKAIASSSAVPVLFDPIELKEFDYEKEDVVRLSDGGLYDNLGLSSLLADECTHIIVSDGSKQLETDKDPSIFRLNVSARTTDVLMHRTRDGEYKMAKSLKDRGIIEKLDIIHLQEVNTGINDELQEKIASIRTDLDSFHELESEAVMYAGYNISSKVLGTENNKEEIHFSKFINRLKNDEDNIFSILDISSKVLFKLDFQDLPKWIYLLCLFILGLFGYFFPVFTLVLLLVSCVLFSISKESLKKRISNIFGFAMRYVSKYYMKYLNSKYIGKGSIK